MIKSILQRQGKRLLDGIYTISPKKGIVFRTYCDMTSDGGGWTLLVSSHSPTWQGNDVRLRNINAPSLTKDYSMLKFADYIKNSYLVTNFEYKLEAHKKGMLLNLKEDVSKLSFTRGSRFCSS